MRWRTLRRIRSVDLDAAFVDVIAVKAMQMSVMQVVAVITMMNALVSAAGLMNMLVRCVSSVVAH